MMNLGDGLLLKLENGKPRLEFATNGAESKSSNPQKSSKFSCQIPANKKTFRIINSKQGLTQPEKHEQGTKGKDAPSLSYLGQNITHGPRKVKNKGMSEDSSSGTDRVQSERNRNDSHTVTKQNFVCLTQEQFQQILSTINTSANDPQSHTEPVASSEEICHSTTTAEELLLNGNNQKQSVTEAKRDTEHLAHGQQSGLLNMSGERGRNVLEAKRTKWRRELDEQLALKRKQKAGVNSHDESCQGRIEDTLHDWRQAQTAAEIQSSKPKAQIQTNRQLPAAIRSAFVPMEDSPVEDAFSAQRAEEQRQWLKELDQQIEDTKIHQKCEKEVNSQAEDIKWWAVHFDSLQRTSAMAPQHREPDISSCLSHRSTSGALSKALEGISMFGGESLGRAGVDTSQGNQPRTSYLRTMTALLDPAQIEERERRRLKQLEHQRAIEAQVEERRRQREKEEATQRAHEEEEEKRVERERERLQQQFQKDTWKQRHREEMQSHKTEELYLSIQRAQKEAFKDKHFQKIKDLAKKGHDVSRLLCSLDGDLGSQAFSGQDSPDTSSLISSEFQIQREEPFPAPSQKKDTAVQTEVRQLPKTDADCDLDKQPPEVAVTCIDAPKPLTSKTSKLSIVKLSEKSHGTATTKAEAIQESYRRNCKQQPGKKPEWNTQRPSKPFVPASERYPEALQRHRQQSRKHRQMELLVMVKNTVSQTHQQDPLPPPVKKNHRSTKQRHNNPAQKQSETRLQEPSAITESRVHSPVPSVRNHLQQSSLHIMEDTDCLQSSDYVPYVRTDEVYQMDPMAPLSRTSTQGTQQRVNIVSRSRQATPLAKHNPSHRKSTERQQAILKGLSELRQGLLQKQREIETSLNPFLQTEQKKHFSTFRPL